MKKISVDEWKTVIELLRKKLDITNLSFDAWIRTLEVHRVENNRIILLTPIGDSKHSYDICEFISLKYAEFIKEAIKEVTNEEYEIVINFKNDL